MANKLFELKLKELSLLKQPFELKDKILYLKDEKNSQLAIVGCEYCYMVEPESTINGFKIDIGNLINYYDKYKEFCSLPVELAINCWLCPHCNMVFRSLIPEFESLEVKNVGI